MKSRRFMSGTSIQSRLIVLFLITTALIFFVNVFVYVNINRIIERIEALYSSNVSLNELSDRLSDVQEDMTRYLKTKSTESLEEYYKYEQDYIEQLERLEESLDEIVKNGISNGIKR